VVGAGQQGAAAMSHEPARAAARTPGASLASTVTALVTRARVDPHEVAPLHGRARELRLLADAIHRLQPRPPLLVGESGVGRTALARALATVTELPVHHLRATELDDPELLRDVVAAILDADGVALLDDLDRLCAEPTPELLAAMGWVWMNGGARVVGVVSPEGRARLQGWLPGIHEVLDPILVPPLPLADTLDVVAQVAPELLAQHGLALAPGSTLVDLTRIAERILTVPALPGRALDLLDLACARARREGARELTPRHWVEVASERTGLSVARVEGRDGGDALDLERDLARRVVGHAHVLETLARAVRRNRAGFVGQRPILVALLLGPSGVGKTEIAKAVADLVFEHDEALLRLDMSEYAEGHAVARIVGAPPGYVGHEAGGVLSEAMLRRPHRVLLLDEIEKAHRDVHQLLLQVFDDGRLTDGRGRTLEFRHSAIIMTSNLGAELIEEDGAAEDETILARARSAFPIELWNRIESPLVLRPLTTHQLHDVCKRLVAASSSRLFKERGIRWTLTSDAEAWLVERARRDPALGARPLRHLLGREVETLVADLVLRGQVRAGGAVRVDANAGALSAHIERAS
jgi:ATP-dependent Clp protease ATP-binding subunit ClpC